MDRRDLFSLSAVTALTFALLPSSAVGQQKSLKDQLVGTWTLVSTDNAQNFGANPKGMLVFDGNGRYSLVFTRSDLPKFATSAADKGTAEENKAVMQGMVAHFGTYTVNEADKIITSRAEGSWFPNLGGTEAKRIITSLTADELKIHQPELLPLEQRLTLYGGEGSRFDRSLFTACRTSPMRIMRRNSCRSGCLTEPL